MPALIALLALAGCPRPAAPPPVELEAMPRWQAPPPPEPSHLGGWHLFHTHAVGEEVLVHVDLLGEDVGDLVALGRASGLEPVGAPSPSDLSPADHELTRRLIHGYLDGTDLVDLWSWSGTWTRGVPATVQRVELASAPTGFLAKHMGWENFFIGCALIAAPGMLLLIKFAPWHAAKTD